MNGSLDVLDVRAGDRVLDVGRRTDIGCLPFEDASFDLVVCRQRLQLLADRGLALSEMRRVLVDGGRATISVSGPIERSVAFAALADSLERHAGVHVAATVRWLFSMPEPEDLWASLTWAGFADVQVGTSRETTFLPSVAELLRFVPRSRMDRSSVGLTERDAHEVVADLERELDPWVGAGGLRLTVEVNTAVGRR